MISTQQTNQSTNNSSGKQGIVTKILENFGFIDDSIFFPLSVVKGSTPVKVGDKVYFECTYAKNLPFNWNATIVQPIQQSTSGSTLAANNHHQRQTSSSSQIHQPSSTATTHHSSQMIHRNVLTAPSQSSSTQQPTPSQTSAPQQPHSHYHHPQQQSSTNHHQQQQQQSHLSTQNPMYHHQTVNPSQQSAQIGTGSGSGGGYHGYQPQPVNHHQQTGHKQVPPQSQFGPMPSQTQQPSLYNAGTPSSGYVAPASQSGPTQSQQAQNSGPPVVPAAALAAAAFNNPTDFAKVQQAVATCTQLAAQYFTPGAGSGSGTGARQTHPDSNHQTPHHPATTGQQYGNTAAVSGTSSSGGIAQLQYTSTPGSAFINSQFNSQTKSLNSGGSNLLQHGQPTQRGSGRWDHPNDDHSHRFAQQRQPPSQSQQPQKMMDNNRGSRFSGGKSRFNQEPDLYPSQINDDRFGSHGMTHGSNFIPPPSDHFRDFVPQRQDMRKDKDNRDFHDRSRDRDNNKLDRDKDRNADRERSRDRDRDRDRDRRDRDRSKRSHSPASSVASSIAGNVSKNSNLSFLPKRRYEPCNIPKTIVIKNRYNSIELRSRLHGSVHIPSDLKEIIYNAEAEFDLFNMPKPIQFKITNEHKESKEKDNHTKESSKSSKLDEKSESKKSLQEKNKLNELKSEPTDSDRTEDKKDNIKDLKQTEYNSEDKTDQESKMEVNLMQIKKEELKTASEVNIEMKDENLENKSKSDTEMIESNKKDNASEVPSKLASNKLASVNKFNVKILLFSLPSLDDIYERLFGTEFASSSFISGSSGTTIKNQVSHFHKLFSLLVAKNSNDGYSLVGGKFQKELDGFLPGTKEPNLVQTAIRVVWEQTGLNLSSCRQWRVLSTFIYNRDNSLNPNEGGYEITKIYSPDIWSAIDCIYQPLNQNDKIQNNSKEDLNKSDIKDSNNDKNSISLNESSMEDNDNPNEFDVSQQNSKESIREDLIHIKDVPNNEKRKYMENILESIQNFKVTELKNELEKFGIKISSRWKKEQLTQELQKVINESLKILDGQEDISLSLIAKKEDITIDRQDSFEDMNEEDNQNNDNDFKESECSQKRKLNDDSNNTEEASTTKTENKKLKRSNEDETLSHLKSSDKENELEQSPSPSNIKVKGNLSTISLHSALNPLRFDQFELIVISQFVRDLLTIHFAHYIYSSIVYNIQLGKPIIPIGTLALEQQQRSNTPANYVHLAFSYFDKGHCGYMLSEDLYNLLNMTGFSISKKNFNYLITSLMSLSNTTVPPSTLSEKIIYMFFQQPSMTSATLIPTVPEYPFVNIFSNNDTTRLLTGNKDNSESNTSENFCPLIVERNSTQYNVDELIKQSEADQKIKVQLNDSYSNALKKIAQLEVQIQELETKQKKMSAATGRQNDELCAVKRDRDGFKTKYEQMKSFANKYCLEFNNLTKSFEKVSASGASQTNNNGAPLSSTELLSTQQPATEKIAQ